ncbi:hypothetical protein fugu_018130 [Takifugu bimaculatus]|uniref:C2H2-type domain-containing protein n=1 Tax=Takifugu bimaculatus TaxID=433685 RepID=A0A4Z2BM10_9TELE|nr:hypothetical protein fugu_018130 [Takifugu bimaculatus]
MASTITAGFANDMNDKQDRPYVCSAPGCSQRFQSEEHLLIHRHKHEMTLKFSSIKTDAAFTDQTPTPTRFLQNCEEVGLFKEIEEEFLQEQERKRTKRYIFLKNRRTELRRSRKKLLFTLSSHLK